MVSTVLVTGATGFLANHVLDTLLTEGYKVIGTARSEKSYSTFAQGFKEKYPKGDLIYEIVPDIAQDGAFDEVLKKHPEIDFVLHTASPFTFGLGDNYKEIFLDPAVNGTTNILSAIKKYAPQVKKVVVTSSFAAILSDPHKASYTNADWNPITIEQIRHEGDAYRASKKYAEKAAWAFVENEKPNFTLTTVNPPFIFGPQLFDSAVGSTLNTSNEVIAKVLRLDPDYKEYLGVPAQLYVDVRDVAKFHVLPLTNDKLNGNRLFITAGKFVQQQIADTINEKIPSLKGKVAKGDPSHPFPTDIPDYDISNILSLIDGGYDFISLEKTVVDTVEQYIKVNGASA